jgi:hypothetical protein
MQSDLKNIDEFFAKFETAKIIAIVETECDANGRFVSNGTQTFSLEEVRIS